MRTRAAAALSKAFSTSAPRLRPAEPATPKGSLARTPAQLSIAQRLDKIFGIRSASAKIRRVEVISEELCDDTIQYLAPLLEKHKGCTIIDLHPGVCIWSAKIHDFLQPRRHVLAEPELGYFEPYIKPLLEQVGSTYRHSSLDLSTTTIIPSFTSIINDEALVPPDLIKPTAEDAISGELNPSILIIGNLARHYPRVQHANSAQFGPKANRYTSAIAYLLSVTNMTRRSFSANGPVRSLLWIPQKDVPYVLPTNHLTRTGAISATRLGNYTTAVVESEEPRASATSSTASDGLRAPELELVQRRIVQALMKEDGVTVPSRRELAFRTDIAHDVQHEYRPLFADLCPSMAALESYIQRCMSDLTVANRVFTHRGRRTQDMEAEVVRLMANLDFPQSQTAIHHHRRQLGATSATRLPTPERGCVLVDLMLRVIKAEASYQAIAEAASPPTDAQRMTALRERIDELDEAVIASLGPHGRPFSYEVWGTADSLIAMSIESLSARDARRLEPLRAKLHEFHPRLPLMLLDMTPTQHDLRVEGVASRDEVHTVAQLLVKQLFHAPSNTIGESLERVAHGASEYILPRVPELVDVRKGGRLDPNKLRVRMLSPEMLVGIVKAFIEWPFRPATWEMELADLTVHEDVYQ